MEDIVEHIIVPVLQRLDRVRKGMYSPKAVMLLCYTLAQESFGGRAVHQQNGTAVSPYQFERIRFDDIEKFLNANANLDISMVVRDMQMINGPDRFQQLHGNFYLSTAYARIGYWMKVDELPSVDDFYGMWAYYKKHWNTEGGSATFDQFQRNAAQYVRSDVRSVLV